MMLFAFPVAECAVYGYHVSTGKLPGKGREGMFSLFHRKPKQTAASFDTSALTPVIRCSICTGEQVAGFRRKTDGSFEEVMLIRDDGDLRRFKELYGITGDIEKIY